MTSVCGNGPFSSTHYPTGAFCLLSDGPGFEHGTVWLFPQSISWCHTHDARLGPPGQVLWHEGEWRWYKCLRVPEQLQHDSRVQIACQHGHTSLFLLLFLSGLFRAAKRLSEQLQSIRMSQIIFCTKNPKRWPPCLVHKLKRSNRAKVGWIPNKICETNPHWWWEIPAVIKWGQLHSSKLCSQIQFVALSTSQQSCTWWSDWKLVRLFLREAGLRAQTWNPWGAPFVCM